MGRASTDAPVIMVSVLGHKLRVDLGKQAMFHPKQHSDMQLLENAHLISCHLLFQAFFLFLSLGLIFFQH